MANNLFNSTRKANNARSSDVADTLNDAGGVAYTSSAKHSLAQFAATNTFNGTYYATGEQQLSIVHDLVDELIKSDPEFVAKTAIYSRKHCQMKDMPAFLLVCLLGVVDGQGNKDRTLFKKTFPLVIDNVKMLRNFVQIARSDLFRYNLSCAAIRKTVQSWFDGQSDEYLFRNSIGNDPTMRDVLRLTRPRPRNAQREALFAYLKDADLVDGNLVTYNADNSVLHSHSFDNLPDLVKHYEAFKQGKARDIPNVDFRMLDALDLGDRDTEVWTEIARNASWDMTRRNLNTFKRHGVFENKDIVDLIAKRLSDPYLIHKSRQLPYNLLQTWKAIRNSDMPQSIIDALHHAMNVSVDNVPKFEGNIVVAVDVSGSMGSPVINKINGNVSSSASCVEVAALIASAIVRKNPKARVFTFSQRAVEVRLNSHDSIFTNVGKLTYAGDGTNCSVVLRDLNKLNETADTIVYASDCESWLDSQSYYNSTSMQDEWNKFKGNNPNAKLVCCDLTPSSNAQTKNHKDVLQVGGFSDNVFNVISSFIEHGNSKDYWVSDIEKVEI